MNNNAGLIIAIAIECTNPLCFVKCANIIVVINNIIPYNNKFCGVKGTKKFNFVAK